MGSLGYSQYRISGRVDVNGRDLPVYQFAAEFPLNGIPKARLGLALGSSSDDEQYLTTLLAAAADPLKIEVKLEMEPQGRLAPTDFKLSESQVPKGEFTAFRGYRTAYSYEREGNRAGITVDVDHWVSDLARSSSLSPGIVPGNVSDLSFPGVLRLATGAETGSVGGVGVFNLLKDVIPAGNLSDDLWAKGLLIWFNALAQSDHLSEAAKTGNFELARLLGSRNKSLNSRAVEALKSMTRPESMDEAEFPPLRLARPGSTLAAQAIVNNIYDQIKSTTFDTLAMRTLWDQLIASASEFMFAVSPAIELVRPVPWTPNLSEPWLRMTGNEHFQFSGQGDYRIPLRAVALITYGQWDAGANPNDNNQAPATDPQSGARMGLGVYTNDDAKDGLVFIRTPPAWLANVPDTIKVNQNVKPDDLTRPGPGGVKEGEKPGPEPAEILGGMNDTLNRFAKATYAFECFKQRQLVVRTPLRFDIAPGSIIAIELVGTNATKLESTYIYGSVVNVSVFIDVEAKTAYTSFVLAHVRTEAENRNSKMTVKEHPLYTKTWKGGRLLEF